MIKGMSVVNEGAFKKLFWGFLFILINFRIMGIDILPDFIGYSLFFVALEDLEENNHRFTTARNLSIVMIILSLLTIYEIPSQSGVYSSPFRGFGIIIVIAAFIFMLMLIYNLFMGIKDLAIQKNMKEIAFEAEERWRGYMWLQVAVFLAVAFIFIPVIGLLYAIGLLIAAIVIAIQIMRFMSKCSRYL
jgi:hypothetical protein